jgi:hypothetical protein
MLTPNELSTSLTIQYDAITIINPIIALNIVSRPLAISCGLFPDDPIICKPPRIINITKTIPAIIIAFERRTETRVPAPGSVDKKCPLEPKKFEEKSSAILFI